jgi:ankyrin repeat protein
VAVIVRDLVEMLVAILTARNLARRDAFLLASASGYMKVCQLVMKHANPLTKDIEGNSAVHLAAMFGYAELTEILLTIEGMEVIWDTAAFRCETQPHRCGCDSPT